MCATAPTGDVRHAYTAIGALSGSAVLREHIVSVPTWIVLGLVAGFVVGKISNKSGEGLVFDIGLGIVGAMAAGLIFSSFGTPGMGESDLYAWAIPVAGAVGSLATCRFLMRSSR